MKKIELLAPAGDMEKLKTAIYFGADAVYFAGKNYGLRAFGTNFEDDSLAKTVEYVHSHGKKAYVTINVYARDADFAGLPDYLNQLVVAKVDAVLVSDMGVLNFVKKYAPSLAIHISTQANTTNKYAAEAYQKMGASRVVLARELSLDEVAKIHEHLPDLELEAFVHGAMCISYSGRCLLSNYLTGRDSNHGECVQACRWKYYVTEETRPGEPMEIAEDDRGTYIFNSKDLRLIEHLDKIAAAGVCSFKVEGRMKSPYYVATVINAYRRAIDHLEECIEQGKKYQVSPQLLAELDKASHRNYTTGFMVNSGEIRQSLESSHQLQESKFMGVVLGVQDGKILVEQRNKFAVGDTLEVLSPTLPLAHKITVSAMTDEQGNPLTHAKLVQQHIFVFCNSTGLNPGDILRM